MPSDSPSSSSSRASSPAPPPKTSSSKKRKTELSELEVDLSLPEPPSKKAKRALKKGKPLPAKQDSDADDGNDDDDDDEKKKPAKKDRSPYGVWIGNLRFTVTKPELRHWLVESSGGAVADDLITRVHLPASKRPAAQASFENRGFAYVDFATYDAAVAAVALSETEWHRRRVLIKDAKSFEGRPAPAPKTKKNDDGAEEREEEEAQPVSTSRKVFVGNMSFQTTEDDLWELFGRCGEIEWVKVATFEDSGKCKGYGWVKFKEAAAADWAAKGFVKVKEVEETEEDFMDDDDDDDDDDDKDKSRGDDEDEDEGQEDEKTEKKGKADLKKVKKAQEKKVKTRKWWVNTLHGRRLKIEHAEDDQTRYKKRFGKKAGDKGQQQSSSSKHKNYKGREDGDGQRPNSREKKTAPAEVSNFREDINVARLTGAAVKPSGKKITFS